MIGLFMPDGSGYRPCHGDSDIYAGDSHFKKYSLFYEFSWRIRQRSGSEPPNRLDRFDGRSPAPQVRENRNSSHTRVGSIRKVEL